MGIGCLIDDGEMGLWLIDLQVNCFGYEGRWLMI